MISPALKVQSAELIDNSAAVAGSVAFIPGTDIKAGLMPVSCGVRIGGASPGTPTIDMALEIINANTDVPTTYAFKLRPVLTTSGAFSAGSCNNPTF